MVRTQEIQPNGKGPLVSLCALLAQFGLHIENPGYKHKRLMKEFKCLYHCICSSFVMISHTSFSYLQLQKGGRCWSLEETVKPCLALVFWNCGLKGWFLACFPFWKSVISLLFSSSPSHPSFWLICCPSQMRQPVFSCIKSLPFLSEHSYCEPLKRDYAWLSCSVFFLAWFAASLCFLQLNAMNSLGFSVLFLQR